MAGTKAGGLKAAKKNLARDPNFYAKIGAKGGKNGKTGGFSGNPAFARIAGAKGGKNFSPAQGDSNDGCIDNSRVSSTSSNPR